MFKNSGFFRTRQMLPHHKKGILTIFLTDSCMTTDSPLTRLKSLSTKNAIQEVFRRLTQPYNTLHLCSSPYIQQVALDANGAVEKPQCEGNRTNTSTWWIQFRYNTIYCLNHSESSGTIEIITVFFHPSWQKKNFQVK